MFAVYLGAATTLAAIVFAVVGLLGPWLPGLLAVAVPAYLLGIWGGARVFGLASEVTFRRVTYAMIALAALIAMPVLDGFVPA